jgi:hypothetical protein
VLEMDLDDAVGDRVLRGFDPAGNGF